MEEAAELNTSPFDNSRIVPVLRYSDARPWPKGTAMMAVFELAGRVMRHPTSEQD